MEEARATRLAALVGGLRRLTTSTLSESAAQAVPQRLRGRQEAQGFRPCPQALARRIDVCRGFALALRCQP